MGKKSSDNTIQSYATDWGVGDSTTGNLPCSGKAVQAFIKGQLQGLSQASTASTEQIVQLRVDLSATRAQVSSHDSTLNNHSAAIANHAQSIEAHGQSLSDLAGRVGSVETSTAQGLEAMRGEISALEAADATLGQAIEAARGEASEGVARVEQGVAQNATAIEALRGGKVDNSRLVVLSEAQYDALSAKQDDVFYFVYED